MPFWLPVINVGHEGRPLVFHFPELLLEKSARECHGVNYD